MNLTNQSVPPPDRYSDAAYNASPAGKARRKKYRHDNSKWITDAKYLSKSIVFVDGEGINLDDGSHSYVMLGISDCVQIIDRDGLDTRRILRYLFSHLSTEDLNCIYGGSYDFNMWLKDCDETTLRLIYSSNYMDAPVDVFGYGVKWQRGKGFSIEKDGRKIVINDVVSFFQTTFVNACDQYLQDSPTWTNNRDIIIREKAKRGDFTFEELQEIDDYNQLELVLGVELVTELRARLNRVNLRPRRWNGPGAIASALFHREGIKAHMEVCPTPVAAAGRYAYFGGRFEMIRYGAVQEKVYEYDINSAYPTALTKVPSLAGGIWAHTRGDIIDHPFALYHVRYYGTRSDIPGPLGVRAKEGTVSYPTNAETWIWSPEMAVLRRYCDTVPGTEYKVVEVWHFKPASFEKPFGFVTAMYEQRQALKAAGDGAQIALKLALNSMYGKTAQQVGYIPGTASMPPRIPPYHQLEWAGFVTSWTRATVLSALLDTPGGIESAIAFETDAVFTTKPLDIKIGSGLGEWEVTEFDSLTYVQSGHYYGTTTDGKEVAKCRGIDRGFVSRETVEDTLRQPPDKRILPAELTRFYGAGVALARNNMDLWCTWRAEPKNLNLAPSGKRLHVGCDACDGDTLTLGVWHTTICPTVGGKSREFPVMWINPDPNMTDLDDFRRMEVDYENESM